MIDVLFHDTCHPAYTLDTTSGVGGSEFAVIRLANALKRAGLSVALQHHEDRPVKCGALILKRYSSFCFAGCRRRVRWLHDWPGAVHENHNTTLVALTESHAAAYRDSGESDIVVIPTMLPDCIYESSRPPRQFGRYLFASAAVKGWNATYAKWRALRQPGDVLQVMDCGYSRPTLDADSSLEMLQPMTDIELVNTIAQSSGIFYVNTHAEISSATLAIAEAVGTPIYMWTTEETITRNIADTFTRRSDHRISTILPKWLEVLGLQ